ncbi:stage III sporulation protein AF [Bacillus thermotolerans]|uniref:Stage III sporulation protein AF n=1 Tax=Bacillus thermotolerans TaxID=1221996 RepID=A0A0F5IBV2_BACTR|nr:stage III sporulation protein AF [Bacillus thermotolerans]KKB42953.1 Stage III sporulation protein AF [Bacillus thermotolerans]
MDILTDWLTDVIVFILLAAVMDALLPSNSFQQYAKIAVGLLLLFVMLQPLWKIFSVDAEQELTKWADGVMTNEQASVITVDKQSSLENSRELFILKSSEQQMKELVQEEVEQAFQRKIVEVDIKVSSWENSFPESIEHIDVYVASLSAGETMKPVEEVAIQSQEQEEEGLENKIASFLSQKWNISEEQLNIHMVEEGDSLE